VSAELHQDGGSSPAEVEIAIVEFGRVLDDMRGAHSELTARAKHMEAELCEANAALEAKVAELEAILHDLPTGVVVRDAQGAVVHANPAAQALLGESERDLQGRTSLPALDALVADGTPYPLAGSTPRIVALRRSPVTLGDGTPAGSVEIIDDRTEFELMTQRVHQQSKMAALGTMAGGIAHEIRNPLNAVRGFASLLSGHMPEGSTEARWTKLIEEGVDECDSIVGAVLAFAAPERLTMERLEVCALVESALDVVRRELAREERDGDYDLRAAIPAGMFVEGDRIQLRQALRNLIANAVDIQPGGGLVQVEASAVAGDIILRVHDSGPGIPAELVECVTDPFFTTRADGTGLGLALVHTVARLHGGTLDVRAEAGPLGGADMRLEIPATSICTSPIAGSPLVPTPQSNDAR
jgi:signal transduction histidine kinase